jgi:hypothetical protein
MEKNLIIGGYTNYGINQLKPWVLSAKEVAGENTDIVLVAGNTSQATVDWLVENGVIVVPMVMVQDVAPHVLRFLSIYDYLYNNWQNYQYVVTTDVKDVFFQCSPFDIFKDFIDTGTENVLIIASEGLKYKDEPWGDENLKQAYGSYVYEQFKDNEIYNVGTFGGSSEYVKDMVFNIFTNAINRPISICDQAVFNVLINTQPFKDNTLHTDYWACEAGTVADPTKIKGFRPNLLCGEPVFDNGVVWTADREMFPIVHQYDRVPEWKKFVQQKYGQEDDSQMFIYKTM